MSLTESQLKDVLQQEIKGLKNKVDSHDINNCILDAARETGWTLPLTTGFREFWFKERAKRHLFFYLWTESAHKFKFESINLQHRFAQYEKLIKKMDVQYAEALEAYPHEFAGAPARELFGTKIEAGFQYDVTGADTTYSDKNRTILRPDDND